MKKNSSIKVLFQLLLILSIVSCTEPYSLQSNTFQNALVIEAIITNEIKYQEVKLTRTFKLEDREAEIESGAVVKVIDENGTEYNFAEVDGLYKSVVKFQAVPNVNYKLNIITSNGNTYVSNIEKLTTHTPLDNITARVAIKEGVKGVEIVANSYDPSTTSNYYRYTYEETYKIIVPKWSPNKLVFDEVRNLVSIAIRDDPETRVCFSSNKSNDIIIKSTKEEAEDKVQNFAIRFISQDDYSIANRYSILVRQYVQSYDSYNFYKILQSFANSGNVLSQLQPGFVYGNIVCTNNPNEKVVGIFDVSTVSQKRIFFNYDDIFPGELFPDYIDTCEQKEFFAEGFGPTFAANGYFALKSSYMSGKIVFYSNEGSVFQMVKSVCGDCTTFSSNVTPPFWE